MRQFKHFTTKFALKIVIFKHLELFIQNGAWG